MTSTAQTRDPNRLFLWNMPGRFTTSLIIYKQRIIGQVDTIPTKFSDGTIVQPPILLNKPFSERLKDRIRDLVNKRDGTNRDIICREPPRLDNPRVIKYFEQKQQKLTW